MSEELIRELLIWLRDGKEFVLSQAPEVIQQKLAFDSFEAWFQVIGCFAGIVICAIALVWAIRRFRNPEYRFEELPIVVSAVGAITIFILIPFVFTGILMLKKIELAPKVHLLGEFSRMVK